MTALQPDFAEEPDVSRILDPLILAIVSALHALELRELGSGSLPSVALEDVAA
jgi:hypothetical protein